MSTDPVLSITEMVRTRLLASPEFIALCPADRVLDSFKEPGANPLVAIGNGDVEYPDFYDSFHYRAFLDVDVWVRAPNFVMCRLIANAIRDALAERPWTVDGFTCHGLSMRVTTDRDTSEHTLAHATVTLDCVLMEA